MKWHSVGWDWVALESKIWTCLKRSPLSLVAATAAVHHLISFRFLLLFHSFGSLLLSHHNPSWIITIVIIKREKIGGIRMRLDSGGP